MTQIRVIYDGEPTFPATDQHPDAERYRVGGHWVDAIGAAPSSKAVHDIRGMKEKECLVCKDNREPQ